jgi:hypothetical protein
VIGAFTVVALILYSLASNAPTASTSQAQTTTTATTAEPAQPAPDGHAVIPDFTQPLYTISSALVCPPEVAQDPREGYGLEGALAAHQSFFSHDVEKFGCEEVRDGIPVILTDDAKQQLALAHLSPQSPCSDMVTSNIGYVSWCDLRNASTIEKTEQAVENPANAKYLYCMGISPPNIGGNDPPPPTAAECIALGRKAGMSESEAKIAFKNAITSNESVTPQPEAQQSAPPEATQATGTMQSFASTAGRFSILFPATPQQSSQPIWQTSGETTTVYKFSADEGNANYTVEYADYDPASVGASPQAFLQGGENSALAGKTPLTDAAIDLDGIPGRAFTFADADGFSFSIHEFLAETRSYRLIVIARKGYTAAQADQFMNSFKIF